MGKIVSIVGNLGAGKTTLTRLLCQVGGFTPYLERPEARPFQRDFTADPLRWALSNQVDFFLFRCEQERVARGKPEIAVFDAGFDMDFHVFTRHIYRKGYLAPAELDLCQRFYAFARGYLPPPDLIIRVRVDLSTLVHRRAIRARDTYDRSLDEAELAGIEALLDDWLASQSAAPVWQLPLEKDIADCQAEIEPLVGRIKDL